MSNDIVHGRGLLLQAQPVRILSNVTSFRMRYCIDTAGLYISVDGATFTPLLLNTIYETRAGTTFNVWLRSDNLVSSQYEYDATHGDMYMRDSGNSGSFNQPGTGLIRGGLPVAGIDYSSVSAFADPNAVPLAVDSAGALYRPQYYAGLDAGLDLLPNTSNDLASISPGNSRSLIGVKYEFNLVIVNPPNYIDIRLKINGVYSRLARIPSYVPGATTVRIANNEFHAHDVTPSSTVSLNIACGVGPGVTAYLMWSKLYLQI